MDGSLRANAATESCVIARQSRLLIGVSRTSFPPAAWDGAVTNVPAWPRRAPSSLASAMSSELVKLLSTVIMLVSAPSTRTIVSGVVSR